MEVQDSFLSNFGREYMMGNPFFQTQQNYELRTPDADGKLE